MIDWYAFWTGGPIRRAIYEQMKRFIRFMDALWDSLEETEPRKHFTQADIERILEPYKRKEV